MTNDTTRRLVYLHSHPKYYGPEAVLPQTGSLPFAITIASETGSGAMPIAECLALQLRAQLPATAPPWKVFAKGLIEKVLEEHRLPARMARFSAEDANNPVDDVLDELFGLHPSSWLIARKSADTILKLAQVGHVILVGWGAHVVTNNLPNVFHVRLVGSLQKRIQRIQQREQLSPKEALAFIHRQDRGRQRYLKRYFSRQLSEPLLYHLTINTDRFSDDETVHLIAGTALSKMRPQDCAQQSTSAARPASWLR